MDRIAETYTGEHGGSWDVERSRARVHWMVQWARGSRALDWGCSQGISTKLLADKGLDAVGFDVDAEAIAFAAEHFPSARFTTDVGTIEGGFDSLLLGEILEHIEDPLAFLREVVQRVKPEGRVIVTVPHGYNDCLDHRHLFTMTTFLDLVQPVLGVVELDFVDGFIRCVATQQSTGWQPTLQIYRAAEQDLIDQHRRERARTELVLGANKQLRAEIALVRRHMSELKASKSFRLVERMKQFRRLVGR